MMLLLVYLELELKRIKVVIAILKSHDPKGGSSLAKSFQSAWLYISYNHAELYITTVVLLMSKLRCLPLPTEFFSKAKPA